MELTEKVLELTCELIRAKSVTPEDAGCQQLMSERLQAVGFECEFINVEDVTNLWAVKKFDAPGPHLMFAGHTDVVPTGPLEEWTSDPFEPKVEGGILQGRGAADMKSSLAAMVVAMEELASLEQEDQLTLSGTISFLITSDEEGPALYGTQAVIDKLEPRGELPDFCVIGEPSSTQTVGDVVRCGRRGSLNGRLVARGIQGHVAYPDDVKNPIHAVLPALHALAQFKWDSGNEYYPPTSFQISNIHSGTGATNVVPGDVEVLFNFRYSTENTAESLQTKTEAILRDNLTDFDVHWTLSGPPFLTQRGELTSAVTAAVEAVSKLTPELSTSGGTSDGRFISHWNQPGSNRVEVVELGPTNATIHKIDERIGVAELSPLAEIYQQISQRLLAQ